MELTINTPRWAKPLLRPARYKGAWGGRGSGKSHVMAENVVHGSDGPESAQREIGLFFAAGELV